MPKFTHLHVHTHFSMLDGMSKISDLVDKCQRTGMHSIAITDHGNMYGIKEFKDYCNNVNKKISDKIKDQKKILESEDASSEDKTSAQNEIDKLETQFFKPIIGIEAYCAHNSRKEKTDRGWHLILLAKNKKGYQNLCKLSSIAFTEGFYFHARIDHELLEKYHEGIIVSSACLGGEVPKKIMAGDLKGAEESVLWFKNIFGDDYYLELQRHQTDKPGGDTSTFERQQEVNRVLLELAEKHNIKTIATNDVHFVEEEHAEAHDRLICISTQSKFDDPKRMHYTKQEWLKTPEEMEAIFADLPEALENTQEIVDKVEDYSIDSDPIMPIFPIPESFGTEDTYRNKFSEKELFDEFTRDEHGNVVLSENDANKKIEKLGGYNRLYRIKLEADYLAKLTWEGAEIRYGKDLTDEQRERIIFELHIMKTMGFPGYFLIVMDYIRAAREELGVSVGPGRGSAAGSVVAYCLKITDIDPLKYDLLFERFLNPDRISLPDIDVDFDDDGRERVLNWVTEKYGKEKVAHIITYGTMAAKNSIADVARVQNTNLDIVSQLKALIPEREFPDGIKDENGKVFDKKPKVTIGNCLKYVPELKEIYNGPDSTLHDVLMYASQLEGTNRQTGIHACGVIIGAADLTDFAPMSIIKDKTTNQDVVVTQYDGHVIENVGLIKMDFLGLSTLSIIKDTLSNIMHSKGKEIDIDTIPIDDELTYKLFCDGNTIATFQFESAGMQKYLRELKPSVIGDIIAMNALYRPGPMENIPDFIARKQGRQKITYDFSCMEKYLKDTYGITVYQEQVMLLSRELADFTRGESDTLRKAMGKKQLAKMEELYGKFIKQGIAKLTVTENLPEEEVRTRLEKIWESWKKFASYAFNKSHAACYSWVAYQTAYLKAHYPAEFMAANLTAAKDVEHTTPLMAECTRMNIKILPPDVNESESSFTVTRKGEIRFGIGAIKGVGEAATQNIIEERNANGKFSDIFDFLKRVNPRTVNKKCLEMLIKSGSFDCFNEMHRAQYLYKENDLETTPTFMDLLVKWTARQQENANAAQISLFDTTPSLQSENSPKIPETERLSALKCAEFEKESTGYFLTGHPLDDYKLVVTHFTNANTKIISDKDNHKIHSGKELRLAGCISNVAFKKSRNGNDFAVVTIEDYLGSCEISIFGNRYRELKNFLEPNLLVYLKGIIQKGWKDDDSYRFEILSIELLDEILNKKVQRITVGIDLESITGEFTGKMEKILKKCKGKVPVTVIVTDHKQDISLTMHSRNHSVNPQKFVDTIHEVPELSILKLV